MQHRLYTCPFIPSLVAEYQYLHVAMLVLPRIVTTAAADPAARRGTRRRQRLGHLLGLSQQHIDDGELEQRDEDEQQARGHPHVDGLHVADLRQRAPHGALGRRRQHGEETDGDARWRRLNVDPERHPRQDHDEDARNVDLDHEEADVAPKHEPHFQARECP